MQRIMKNLLPTWLVSLLVLGVILTACGPSVSAEEQTLTASAETAETQTETPTNPKPTNTAQATPTPALNFDIVNLEGKTVRFAHPWTGETAEVINAIAKEFNKGNPWKIVIETSSHGGETDLVKSLQEELKQESLPGLVALRPFLLSNLEGKFSIADLQPFYDDPEVGFSDDEQADLTDLFFEPFYSNGKIIGLPIAPQATVMFYNTTWGKELGFSEAPRTFNLFETQACEATFYNWQDKNTAVHGTGGWMINLNPAVLAGWYTAFGGQIPLLETPSFNNPAGIDAFGTLWNTKIKGCIWFALQPDPYIYFADRYTLLYAGTLDQVSRQVNWMTAAGSHDEWEVIGFPGPDGDVIIVDGPGLIITAEEIEDQLAAWLFAKHLLEPKNQAKLAESLLTLPVRPSAMSLMTKVKKDYPQWAQGAALLDSAYVLPVSDAWGVSQWVLQDAVLQLLQAETENVSQIMEALDAMIADMTEESQ